MTEILAAELRALADANRHVAWRHRLNTEDLSKHLEKEGRKIADRLGVEINETALEFLARQVAWTCNIKVGAETNRLNARARRAVSGQKTF